MLRVFNNVSFQTNLHLTKVLIAAELCKHYNFPHPYRFVLLNLFLVTFQTARYVDQGLRTICTSVGIWFDVFDDSR